MIKGSTCFALLHNLKKIMGVFYPFFLVSLPLVLVSLSLQVSLVARTTFIIPYAARDKSKVVQQLRARIPYL